MQLESTPLRAGQRGALYALLAHFAGSHRDTAAQVHLPAGYGKTLVMLLASAILNPREKTLVVCGGMRLREQLHHHFASLYGEGAPEQERSATGQRAWELLDAQERPRRSATQRVYTKVGEDDRNTPPQDARVVIATPKSLGTYAPVDAAGEPEIGLILVDEGHHMPAKTWTEIALRNPSARVIIFTATPFRRDEEPLPGRLVFSYPIVDAINEGSVADCAIEALPASNPANVAADDRQIIRRASALLAQARAVNANAKLLVKFNKIDRLQALTDAYARLLPAADRDAQLLVLHSELTVAQAKDALKRASEADWRIALSVEMLSEGIDSPDIRVLAVHDNIPGLGHFVQVAGRAGRTQIAHGGAAEPSYVVMLKSHMPPQLQNIDVRSLVDVAGAISSAVVVEEQRTTLLEQIEDGHVPEAALLEAIPHLRLREHTRVFVAPAGATDWTRLAEFSGGLVLGSASKPLANGTLTVAIVATTPSPMWLGALATPRQEAGLLLTFEPTQALPINRRYIFISATSAHKGLVDVMTQALAGQGMHLRALGLSDLKRLYGGAGGVTYYNLGLRARMPSPRVERYRTVTGGEIELAVSSDTARGFSQGHVIGRKFDSTATGRTMGDVVGISGDGAVWGAGIRNIEALCETWMHAMAVRLSTPASAPAKTAVDSIPVSANLDFGSIPDGAGAAAFWGPETILQSLALVAQDKTIQPWTGTFLSSCTLSPPTANAAAKQIEFSIIVPVDGAVAPFTIALTIRDTPQLFHVDPEVCVEDERGERLSLAAWLRGDAPSLFLSDGSCLQGRAVSTEPDAGSILAAIAANRYVMDWADCEIQQEKPIGFEPDKKRRNVGAPVQEKMVDFDPRLPNPRTNAPDRSIFTRVALKMIERVEAGSLALAVCDDDAYELADFIAMRGAVGGAVTVELYLCKASGEAAPGLRSLDVAELWSQAMRAAQLLTRESLLKQFERGMNRMVMAPLLADAKARANELLQRATTIEFEIILVQPGLNLDALSPDAAGVAGPRNTVAHAFASIAASLQNRGVRLLLVGGTRTRAVRRAAGRQPVAAVAFPDVFARVF